MSVHRGGQEGALDPPFDKAKYVFQLFFLGISIFLVFLVKCYVFPSTLVLFSFLSQFFSLPHIIVDFDT